MIKQQIAIRKRKVSSTPVMHTILLIPSEIQKRMCEFLCLKDAIRYSHTCKQIKKDLALSCLNIPPHLSVGEIHERGDYHSGDSTIMWFKIPLLQANKIHSIFFNCKWNDQGWGNRKGRLVITEGFVEGQGVKNHPIVATSPIAAHHETPLRLCFQAELGRKYYVWYKVGGGGGHTLSVRQIRISMAIYDEFRFSDITNEIIRINRIPLMYTYALEMLQLMVDLALNQIAEGKIPEKCISSKLIHYCGMDAMKKDSLESIKHLIIELEPYAVDQINNIDT